MQVTIPIICIFSVYSSQLQEVSPSLPATIMMDEDLPGSPEDDLSSPHDFTMASPRDAHDDGLSPQSADAQEVNSDIEVDV